MIFQVNAISLLIMALISRLFAPTLLSNVLFLIAYGEFVQ